jgi:hypothetical protein
MEDLSPSLRFGGGKRSHFLCLSVCCLIPHWEAGFYISSRIWVDGSIICSVFQPDVLHVGPTYCSSSGFLGRITTAHFTDAAA